MKCRGQRLHVFVKGEDKCAICGWEKPDSIEPEWKTLSSTGVAHLFIGKNWTACGRILTKTTPGHVEAWRNCLLCVKAAERR